SSNGFTVTDASMGVIAVGIARLATPLRFFTADTADGTEKALVPLVATTFWAASGVFFLRQLSFSGFWPRQRKLFSSYQLAPEYRPTMQLSRCRRAMLSCCSAIRENLHRPLSAAWSCR